MSMTIEDCPEKFYKYRPMNDAVMVGRVNRIVVHREIYFASASSFNDPFDLRPAFSLEATPERHRDDFIRLSKKYQPHLTEEQHNAEADSVMATSMSPDGLEDTTRIIQAVHATALGNVGVFCVSTRPDDILMWAHYADSHMGVCLEFDGMSSLMAEAQKVIYSCQRRPINPYNDNYVAMAEKALLTKSEHWCYEDEWRLVRYAKGPGNVQYHPGALTGIILGALASWETEKMVREWIGKLPNPVTIYRAKLSPTKYEVLISVPDKA